MSEELTTLDEVRKEENVFWSFAPHDISLLQFLIGKFPLDITIKGGSYIQEGIHDTTLTILEYPNNIKAHIYLSWLHPFKEHRIVIIGSKGMISFEDSSPDKQLKFYKKKFSLIELEYSIGFESSPKVISLISSSFHCNL